MIYTKNGVPMDAMFWMGVRERIAANLHRNALRTKKRYLLLLDGSRAYRVVKDRLGDPIRVYRDVTLYR